MANTRRNTRKNAVARKERKASRKNAVARKERKASRKNAVARKAAVSRKDRKASRKAAVSRKGRKAAVSRKGRKASRRNMKGGSKGIVSRVYRPVGALGTGAGKTLTTAATAAVNVFNTGVHGIDKTLKTAAGTINDTVSKIFSRRRRAERRH